MIGLVGLSILLFASTNIDDIFVLIAFFAERRIRAFDIAAGQYIGIATLFVVSVAASLISLTLTAEEVGLLGVLPIVIGLWRLAELYRGSVDEATSLRSGPGAALSVAAVTIANGGDNIGVYTPFFAMRSTSELLGIAALFAALTAIWLMFGYWLVVHPHIGAPIRRNGHRIVPFVLIGLGLMILRDAGSFELIARLL